MMVRVFDQAVAGPTSRPFVYAVGLKREAGKDAYRFSANKSRWME